MTDSPHQRKQAPESGRALLFAFLGLVGFGTFVPALVSLHFASEAKKAANEEPELYSGRVAAISRVISFLSLTLGVVAIAVVVVRSALS